MLHRPDPLPRNERCGYARPAPSLQLIHSQEDNQLSVHHQDPLQIMATLWGVWAAEGHKIVEVVVNYRYTPGNHWSVSATTVNTLGLKGKEELVFHAESVVVGYSLLILSLSF